MFAWQATVQDERGNAVPSPVVIVYESDGVTLASIYNEAGGALPNPFTGTPEGFVQFWADIGVYKIEGASGSDRTEVWSVELGVSGKPFPTRAAFLAANVPPVVTRTSFFVSGNTYAVVRDATGPIVQDNGQRWRPDGVTTLQHFGATGLGDQAIDEAAWAAAVAWAEKVYLPSGTYILRRAKVNNASKVKEVYGSGYDSLVIHPAADVAAAGGATSVIDVEGTSGNLLYGVFFHSFRVDGNRANIVNGDANNCEGINFNYSRGCHAAFMWFENIISEGIDADYCEDCTFTSILGKNCGGMVVHLSTQSQRCHTFNSGGIDCGLTSGRPAFDVFGSSKDCSINNCWSIGCYRGFNASGENTAVRGFTAIDSLGWGAWLSASGMVLSDIVIDGASLGGVEANNAGIQLNCDRTTISNLTIKNATGVAVRSSSTHTTINGLLIGGATGNAVHWFGSATNNVIEGMRLTGGVAGVADSGTDNRVSNFDITGCSADGIIATGTRGRYGPGRITAVGGDGVDFSGTDNVADRVEVDGCVGAGYRILVGAVRPRLFDCNVANWGSVRITNASTTLFVRGGFNGDIVQRIADASVTDNTIQSGVYIYDTGAGSSGGPSGVTRGTLHHYRRDPTGGEVQTFTDENSPRTIYVRSRSTGAWSAWATMWNNLNTQVDGNGFIKVIP